MVAGSRVRSNELMTSANPSENPLAPANPLASGAGANPVGTVAVGIGPLSFDDVVAVARHDARVEITPESLDEIRKSRTIIAGA